MPDGNLNNHPPLSFPSSKISPNIIFDGRPHPLPLPVCLGQALCCAVPCPGPVVSIPRICVVFPQVHAPATPACKPGNSCRTTEVPSWLIEAFNAHLSPITSRCWVRWPCLAHRACRRYPVDPSCLCCASHFSSHSNVSRLRSSCTSPPSLPPESTGAGTDG
ncbi:hypothetical protein CCHR01_07277 [Colletotrichum chrysophilum]|uniref:Uncharacterized protein n=1 Tax=Colletotrichum chrysophilum TaxID=1836956 RepID=A0AAD9AP11_9PEZI|nr:hypothetical protein CCHR01_07277 [Colletotrichum chrysophilum]